MKSATWFIVILCIFVCNSSAEGVVPNFRVYEDLFSQGILKRLASYLEEHHQYDFQQCGQDILTWLRNSTQAWALEMHDANGKLESGLMKGHLHTMGSFDECLGVERKIGERTMRGKYCFAKLALIDDFLEGKLISNNFIKGGGEFGRGANFDQYNRVVYNWAVCVPDSCAAQDIQNMLKDLLLSIGIVTGDKPIIAVPEDDCSTSEKTELSGGAIAAITVLSIFALIMLLSTGYDLYTKDSSIEKSRLHNVLISFSMYTNSKKLFKINKSSSSLRCLHGIRSISLLWVIIGHRYTTLLSSPTINLVDMLEWTKTYPSIFITGGTFSVDTFFVLSGLLLSYVLFSQNNKKRFNLLFFYIHRLLRLWPAMAMTVFVQTTLYSYLGDGPYWSYSLIQFTVPCREAWWSSLIYLSNYLTAMEICVGQLWYLCCDMQLYILSPILIYPLLYKPKIGIGNLVFWIVAAQVTVTAISYSYDMPWSILAGGDMEEYMTKYYTVTHARAAPWLLGFAAGYFISKTSHTQFKINKVVALIYWLVTLLILAAIFFTGKDLYSVSHEINIRQDGSFNAFARTGWAVGLIMLILACVKGYGGPINWFLSLRVWEIFGRFSYSMYLLHFGIMYGHRSVWRVTGEFSHFQIVYQFFGDVVISGIFSYLWIMAFESPFLVLERSIFYKKTEKKPAVEVSARGTIEKVKD